MIHSVLRYALLVLLLLSIFFSLRGIITKAPILIGHRAITVWTVVLAHTQVVIGLILYIMRGWYAADHTTSIGRFWKMEHIGMMLVAVILITVGRVLSKKADNEYRKQLYILVFFLIAVVLILASIPWPVREVGYGRGWI
ncbi:MAG: cytochrome B [Bacteroidota bacterium]|nr:cytochrome B [Bacteroidota bacterium]